MSSRRFDYKENDVTDRRVGSLQVQNVVISEVGRPSGRCGPGPGSSDWHRRMIDLV